MAILERSTKEQISGREKYWVLRALSMGCDITNDVKMAGATIMR